MDYIDSENLSEVQLGVKKLQLNIRSNSIFEKNLLAYTENLTSLIKQPTSFKNPEKPSVIELILTNSPTPSKLHVL